MENKKLSAIINNDNLEIFDASEDGVLIIDSDATIIYCNDVWVELCAFNRYGYCKNDMIGMDLNFFINSGIGVKAVALKALKDKKKTTSLAYSLDDKVIVTKATPFFNKNGTVKYVVAFLKDESEIHNLKSSLENINEIQSMFVDYLYSGKRRREKQIIVENEKLKEIYVQALKISGTNATVLINGESGCGKDVLANFIHDYSNKTEGSFVAINCGAIPENLMESEFFGYEKGSFTGANKEGKKGFFEAAHKGTLFLDEIAELPLSMQTKLLRVLETQQITRVGGTKPIDVDVRIIAATNRDLQEQVELGNFRLDLYYRINVIKFTIPPLKERKEDLEALAKMFMENFNEQYGYTKQLSEDALKALTLYNWPGNVRELRNLIESLVLMTDGDLIERSTVDKFLSNERKILNNKTCVVVKEIAPLREVIEEAERQLLTLASRGLHNSRDIARILEIDQTTASRKLKKYGVHYK